MIQPLRLSFSHVSENFFRYMDRMHPNLPNYSGEGPSSLRRVTPNYLCYLVGTNDCSRYVVSGGVEEYQGSWYANKRLWVHPSYRKSGEVPIIEPLTKTSLKYLFQLGKQPLSSEIVFSFEEHNKALFHGFLRMSQGRRANLLNQWCPLFQLFKPSGKREVHGVDQYTCTAPFKAVRDLILKEDGNDLEIN